VYLPSDFQIKIIVNMKSDVVGVRPGATVYIT
jgi:hypothetical protein